MDIPRDRDISHFEGEEGDHTNIQIPAEPGSYWDLRVRKQRFYQLCQPYLAIILLSFQSAAVRNFNFGQLPFKEHYCTKFINDLIKVFKNYTYPQIAKIAYILLDQLVIFCNQFCSGETRIISHIISSSHFKLIQLHSSANFGISYEKSEALQNLA